MRKIASTPITKLRLANSAISMMGTRPAADSACSYRTKCRNTSSEASGTAHDHHGQPNSRPCMMGTSSMPSATAPASAPCTSRRAATGARDSVTNARAASSAAIPMGTLTRNTMRQPPMSAANGCPISQPPASCDSDAAAPCTAPITPNARRRSSPSNNTRAVAITCGIRMAAPRPCASRMAINIHALVASPHRADASVNSAMPARNMRLRPNRSPRRAPLSRNTA